MALDALKIQELPSLRSPILVAAFAGWPDAAEVASGTARFLSRKLRARRFAEIDPEAESERPAGTSTGELLSQLEHGTLTVDQVLRQLRKPEDRT